jgi:hypothetical protein
MAISSRSQQRIHWFHDRSHRKFGSISTQPPTPFRLLDLPLEMREEIYTATINAEYEITEIPIVAIPSKCRPRTVLSLVNGQIHDEVVLSDLDTAH